MEYLVFERFPEGRLETTGHIVCGHVHGDGLDQVLGQVGAVDEPLDHAGLLVLPVHNPGLATDSIFLQCPLDIKTLDIAAALAIAAASHVTDLRQYINSNLGYSNLKFVVLCTN